MVVQNRTSTAVNPRELRNVLGHFGSGVTIVTAMSDGGPVGFTCQSFSALSLDPAQVVLCPSRSSTSWPEIRKAQTFCVNVLSASQRHLSDRFARSGGAKFGGVEWRPAGGGAPILAGASAWFELSIRAEHPGGDHTVVVADVVDFAASTEKSPLMFAHGRYCTVAEFD